MKLRADDVAALNGTRKTVAVMRRADRLVRMIADDVIRMHEVETRLPAESRK